MTGARALKFLALAAALIIATSSARAHDESKYPDWKGNWWRNNSVFWDPSKPPGLAQKPPLTREYQAIWEAALKRQDAGTDDGWEVSCLPPGMPRAMIVYEPMEFVIQPDVTFILLSYFTEIRRVFTDGR